MEEKEKKWGGKRENSGRLKSSTKVYKTIRLEKKLLEELEKLEGTFTGKVVDGLELLIKSKRS